MTKLMPTVVIAKADMPNAVAVFRGAHLAPGVLDALLQMDDAERELKRLRPLASVEDQGDREELLALYAAADKTVSSHAERVGSHLRSLA